MEESLAAKIIHAVIFIGVCTVILSIGWNEPLRYRFMSPDEIAEAEGRTEEVAPPAPKQWEPMGTTLDRAQGERNGGSIIYSKNPDPR